MRFLPLIPDDMEESLIQLIRLGEGPTVEFKRGYSYNIEKTISAFANSDGGYILFGIEDDKRIVGIKEDEINTIVRRLKSVCISISVEFDITVDTIQDASVIILHIYKNKTSYPVMTSKGEVFVRSNDSNNLSSRREDNDAKTSKKDKKIYCFVAMSFREQEYPRLVDYYDAMLRAAEKCNYNVEVYRVDSVNYAGDVIQKIHDDIKKCNMMIADFTCESQNVYYEAGYGKALNKGVIQTAESGTELKFDISHNNTYYYTNAHTLEVYLINIFNDMCPQIKV